MLLAFDKVWVLQVVRAISWLVLEFVALGRIASAAWG